MLIYENPDINLDDFDSEFLNDVFEFLRDSTTQQQIATNQWQEFLQAAHIREQVTNWSGFCSFLIGLITRSDIDVFRYLSEIPIESLWESEDLKSADIPANIKAINSRAFYSCEQLEHIAAEQGLEFIGREAFKHCTSLWDVVLPSSLREISREAFNYCWNLSKINFQGTMLQCRRLNIEHPVFPQSSTIEFHCSDGVLKAITSQIGEMEWKEI